MMQEPDIIVVAPDGTEVSFPAGTSRETMQRAMMARFSPESPSAALARYREANPGDTGARVVQHGDPDYPGSNSRWDDGSGTYVGLTAQEIAARDEARRRVSQNDDVVGVGSFLEGVTFNTIDEIGGFAAQGVEMARNALRRARGEEIPYTSSQLRDALIAESEAQRDRFAEDRPLVNAGLQVAGGFAAPGVMTAGKWVANAPNIVQATGRGMMTGSAIGGAYSAGAADGGLMSRGDEALAGAMTGGAIGGALPPLARVTGSAVNSMGGQQVADRASDFVARMTGRPVPLEHRAARDLFRGVNIDDAQQRLDAGRQFGADLTAADIGGSRVQSRVRVAATRQTPGREVAEDFAAGRREDMQDYLGNLAGRMSPIDATPNQIDDVLQRWQRETAGVNFDRARSGPPVTISPDVATALWSGEGRRAVAAAARAYASATTPEDQAIARELAELASRMGTSSGANVPASGAAGLELSVGAADLLSRYLLRAGGTDANLQRIFGGLGRAIRDEARNQSTDYGLALDEFAARARMGDAVGVGDAFMGRGRTGDFVEAVGSMDDRTRSMAMAAARNAVDSRADTPASAMGALDRLATGRGAQRRMTALYGPEVAGELREGAQIGRRMIQTGNSVNPRAGSNTFLNNEDGGAAASVIGNLLRGRFGTALGGSIDLLRSRGIGDDLAEEIVNLALDPNRTEDVLRILRTQFPEREAQRLLSQLSPMIAGQAGEARGQLTGAATP